MSAEITSFSKRAAAEITRCFNGISNTVNSSSTSSSSSSSASSTSSRNLSSTISSSITGINHQHYPQQQLSTIKTKVVDQSHQYSGKDQNDSSIEQKINSSHSDSMGTTTTTTRQTLNNNSTSNNTDNSSLTSTNNHHSHHTSHYSNQLANFGNKTNNNNNNNSNNNNIGSGKQIRSNEIQSTQHLSPIVNSSNKTITTKITTGNTNTTTTTTTTTSSTTSSTSFGARTAFGGAFRVFKNSEKLLSPLKGKSSTSITTSATSNNNNNNNSNNNDVCNSINKETTSSNVTGVEVFGGNSRSLINDNSRTVCRNKSGANSDQTGSALLDQTQTVPMMPIKPLNLNQSHSHKQQTRRTSRHGPPPKAPPKTNRARRKNYLLNLQKSKTIDELFLNVQFLKQNFFKHFPPIELCHLSQVCKIWYLILYSNSNYWRDLTFTIRYDLFRQQRETILRQQYGEDRFEHLNVDDKSAKKINANKDDYPANGYFKLNDNTSHKYGTKPKTKYKELLTKWNELCIDSATKLASNECQTAAMKSISDVIALFNQNSINIELEDQEQLKITKLNKDKNVKKCLIENAELDEELLRQRQRLYYSILLRCFDTICIKSASDSDLVELINFFKLSSISTTNTNANLFKNIISNSTNNNNIDNNKTNTLRTMSMSNIGHILILNSSITDNGLELLLKNFASTLHSFELIGCNELSNAGLWFSLVPNLTLLTIQDCINISDDTVATLCQLLPSLQTLQFQAYHVTDIAMAYFGPSMMRHTLRVLTLQDCWEITNQGVANVAHSLPNLTSLSLAGCSKVTDEGIEVVAEQLRSLVTLDLSWCPRISDATLEYIACDLTDSLRTLILDRSLHVSDIGLGYLATMANLENLSVRWCPQIRDFGLQALSSLRSLRTLSIAGCSKVTMTGLSFLVRMPQLKEIELTNCPAATKELIKYLKGCLPKTCTIIT